MPALAGIHLRCRQSASPGYRLSPVWQNVRAKSCRNRPCISIFEGVFHERRSSI